MTRILAGLALALTLAPAALAGPVLGPCGTDGALEPTVAPALTAAPPSGELTVASVPLPGEQAPNFELQAVVGDEVETIRLSDYDGKWRVVCFYPADFTFV